VFRHYNDSSGPAVVALTAPAADLFGQVYDPIRGAGLAELIAR
jgi:hypothetical protein